MKHSVYKDIITSFTMMSNVVDCNGILKLASYLCYQFSLSNSWQYPNQSLQIEVLEQADTYASKSMIRSKININNLELLRPVHRYAIDNTGWLQYWCDCKHMANTIYKDTSDSFTMMSNSIDHAGIFKLASSLCLSLK